MSGHAGASGAWLTRRAFCAGALAAGAGVATLAGCRGDKPNAAGADDLVVYCSADSVYAAPIFEAFTRARGVRVRPVYDTEATKTTGLVNRLLEERASPRADVWWSSEPFGTLRLADAGVLEPSPCPAAEASLPGGWPAHLRDPGAGAAGAPRWYGFGSRARVYVFNTKLLPRDAAPDSPARLLDPALKGRIAMARPQFGTTRGHMGLLAAVFGPGAFERWLAALRANGVRLVDGNAAVVRAVATGEAWAGLTDSDDVFAGQREGWPVDYRHEAVGPAGPAAEPPVSMGPEVGPCGTLLLPNTVARVRGGPGRAGHAAALVEYLLGPAAQRLLAESDSRNLPVDPALAKELCPWAPAPGMVVTTAWSRIAAAIPGAMAACERALGA